MSRSITSDTAAPSTMPIMHISAVRESSAGYFFKVKDWTRIVALFNKFYHQLKSKILPMNCKNAKKRKKKEQLLTCNMKKPAQPQQLARSINVPVSRCWLPDSLLVAPRWAAPCDLIKSMIGPLYKVITMAPVTVITVPTTLAALCSFLKLTVSNLFRTYHI